MMGEARSHAGSAGEAFWRFSLALYSRPGVAAALLELQDRAGANVNLVLYALWLGATQQRAIGAAEIVAAERSAAPLSAAGDEIRGLRRGLKARSDGGLRDLQRRALQLELAAERQVQRRLAAVPAFGASHRAGEAGLAAALANLACVLGGAAGSSEARVLRGALTSLMRLA
jgi:uncharacterized protein (TIGR02444 family)